MKRFRLSAAVLACTVFANCFSGAGAVLCANAESPAAIYEAEDAESESVLVDDGTYGKQFSGKACLIDREGEYVRFTFRTESSGFYRLQVALCGYFEGTVVSDGSESAKIYLSYEDTAVHTLAERTFFSAGSHTLEFAAAEKAYCAVDYLSVSPLQEVEYSEFFDVGYGLSNPNATEKTKRLFSFLQANYGKNIISGQNTTTGFRDGDFQRILEKTGKLPAIMGLDLQEYSPSLGRYRTDTVIGYALEYAALGGIVTLQWHWVAPTELLLKNEDGTPKDLWAGFRTRAVDPDAVNAAMNDKTSEGYRALISDLDEIAVQLKRLSDADVPVLFRPLHEASGRWFWWGLGGSEGYVELWKTTYRKFTEEYRLNNLIWVWNGQSKAWYPGDEYVDVVGEDVYVEAKNYTEHSGKFAEVIGYSDTPKITALTECGVLFDVDEALERKTVWSWFLNWGWVHAIPKSEDQIYATDADGNYIVNTNVSPQEPYPIQTELAQWKKVFNHENVLTLEDSPFHRHSKDENEVCKICGAAVNESADDKEEEDDEQSDGIEEPNGNEGSGGKKPIGLILSVSALSVLSCALLGITVFLAVKLKRR